MPGAIKEKEKEKEKKDKKDDDEKEEKKRIPLVIADFTQHHTDTNVHFVVKFQTKEALDEIEAEGLMKRFKLTTTISTTNMIMFDRNGTIRKYTPDEVLEEFFAIRMEFYSRRKVWRIFFLL
jgi:DNA topoisomerase-2